MSIHSTSGYHSVLHPASNVVPEVCLGFFPLVVCQVYKEFPSSIGSKEKRSTWVEWEEKLVSYHPVQYHVLEVEEQQGIHILGPILGLEECDNSAVIGPEIVGTGQLVLEESAENPGS